jgi:uncharacterized protein (TIGR03118 family)
MNSKVSQSLSVGIKKIAGPCVLCATIILAGSARVLAQHYQQTNLVSDVPGLAPITDSNLVNPWGLAASSASPWWVADNGTGVSTLYNGAGQIINLTVTVPTPIGGTPPSAPTGIVFNPRPADFGGARFIFVTEEGTISAWSTGTLAVLKFTSPTEAIYKGVTIAEVNGVNFLYVANFFNGSVDVFDTNFVPAPAPPGAFTDPQIPAGYGPFNVQNIGGNIFVGFAKQDDAKEDEVAGRKLGFVDEFDANGVLIRRFEHGPWMDAPWGLALAPDGFGKASGRLLVGMFGSGQVATFDATTGEFEGLLRGRHGQPIEIDGLWALAFGNNGNAGPKTTLFFTAGIDDEAHGLFGTITPIPKKEDDDDNGDDG